MNLKITSLQHPLVKHLVKLREDRAYRTRSGSALLCGLNLIGDLADQFEFLNVFVEEDFHPSFAYKTQNLYRVTKGILKKTSGIAHPEPIVAEILIPKEPDLSLTKYLLVLDGISDPGNLGTLLRTASGLGWDGVFLTPRSTDPFNDKAIRAAKGATFTLPWQRGSYEELFALLKNRSLYSADAKGGNLLHCKFSPPLALALGNESKGLGLELKEKGKIISIPMNKQMESLNVATAGAIMMYAIKK